MPSPVSPMDLHMTDLATLSQHARHIPEALQAHSQQLIQRFIETLSPLQLSVFEQPQIALTALKVCICSEFVRDSWLRHPDLIQSLVNSGDLFSASRRDQYPDHFTTNSFSDEAELAKALRLFRRREMVRIAWRDLAGWADLNETLSDLSALAELCIQTALNFNYQKACQRWGTPTLADGRPFNIVVLGMGKLGAWELNYSSDIDLIFAYAEQGELNGKQEISYGEFFTHICRSLIKMLDETTVDGFVFRTDVRLRPFGDSGPLIMTFDGMENYYLSQAREWERYAMIKARQVAGDFESGQYLQAMIKPFVYRRYLDYGAFDELRNLKQQITQELRRKDRMDNVKLGPGGIREIEFIGQAFQLIRGGQEVTLQQREIQVILAELDALKLMTSDDVANLQMAYRFLRRVENHIQEYQDRQAHDLPKDPLAQTILAYSMDFEDWPSFKNELDEIRASVHAIFEQVFSINNEADSKQTLSQLIWSGDDQAVELLGQMDVQDADQIAKILRDFRNTHAVKRLTSKGLKVINRLMPKLIDQLPSLAKPAESLQRLTQLFEAVAGRNVYLALLAENPGALDRLLQLASASPWICNYLAQYPILFDELLDSRALFAPLQRSALVQQLSQQLEQIDTNDDERLMTALRQFKHLNVLRVAAADIMGVIPVMVVSDYLTWIAEAIVEQTLKQVWQGLAHKHGIPETCDADHPGFAVIAFGKFGGIELGYGSDLDLVFLHNSHDSDAMTDGEKPINCGMFYLRLAQKFRHLFETRMLSGVLYPIDIRLRPYGDSGLWVSHIDNYLSYYQQHAWTWEHQALVRARFVAGDSRLAEQFTQIRQQVMALPRSKDTLRSEISEMREKMRAHLGSKDQNFFDLKHGAGGITDIEFIVQLGVLAASAQFPELARYTDNVRLLEGLNACHFFSAEDSAVLKQAYCSFRDLGHHCVLQDQAVSVPNDELIELRVAVQRIWQKLMV